MRMLACNTEKVHTPRHSRVVHMRAVTMHTAARVCEIGHERVLLHANAYACMRMLILCVLVSWFC